MMDSRVAEAMSLEKEVASVTLDSIGAGVLRTDLHGNVTYLNRMAEEMTGWRREEARGRPVAEVFRLIDAVSRAAVGNALGIVMPADKTAGSMANSRDGILVRRDGFEFSIESKVTLVYDHDQR